MSLIEHAADRICEPIQNLAEKANALNADAAVGWYHATLFHDYYLKGDYERALELIRQDPTQQAPYVYNEYIEVYGQLGRKGEALENWRKLLKEEPSWTVESFENWHRLWNKGDEDIAKLMDVSTSRVCSGWRLSPASDPGAGSTARHPGDDCPLWVKTDRYLSSTNFR